MTFERPSTGFLTDQYEFTMIDAAIHAGTANRDSVFELFGRRLPSGRRYGVVAGVGRALELLRDFRFGDAEIEHLKWNASHYVDNAKLYGKELRAIDPASVLAPSSTPT